MIKLGAAVKHSPTTAERDALSVVDVVVTEASSGSAQTPVPVVAEEDARHVPSKPVIAQTPVPSEQKGNERKTVHLTLARPPAVAPDPDLAPRRPPARVRANVPVKRQGSPARPQPSAHPGPSAVPEIALPRPPAHTRSPAHTRPAVPDKRAVQEASKLAQSRSQVSLDDKRVVQEAPKLAHRRSQVSLNPQHSYTTKSDARQPCPVPVIAQTRSPTPQRSSTSQRAVQEVPKIAHGRSRVPLDSLLTARNIKTAHNVPVVREVPAASPVPVSRDARPSRQRTPTRIVPAARPTRPSQQRTPVRPHPDARPRSPACPAISRSPKAAAQPAHLSPARQRAKSPSRYCQAAQSRPRPVVTDTRQHATAHSRSSVAYQPTARPRIQPSTPPHKIAPVRQRPSPSPTRDRAPCCAPAPSASHAHTHARASKREYPATHDSFTRDPDQGFSRDHQCDRHNDRQRDHARVTSGEEPLGTGDFAASPSGGEHQESEQAFWQILTLMRNLNGIPDP
ncbi:serine/arginine repetitive matrix protein 1-like [Palaemon carinicauda]|uniref:serine/arginine repetitive matrix protein 1-like n=1 Tax=Palaemon carinicauda TaxID=392227 RepID=UPI0035B5E54D